MGKKEGKKSRLKIVLVFLVIGIIILVSALIFSVKSYLSVNVENPSTSGENKPSSVQKQTASSGTSKIDIVSYLESNELIKKLPDDAVILLRFYNFNTGEREWENSYILKRSSVVEGLVDNADITLVMKSKYLSDLATKDFCTVIKTAKANDDLGVWTDELTVSLLWKFRSVLSYKECFGL